MSKKIRLVDCSLRDGHQSLLATRMSTEQCLRVLPMLRDAGYTNLELWGGATLDSAMRFTGDNPWERLDKFNEVLQGKADIRSLCRGQNLFGYTPYPDNIVYSFLKEAVKSGNNRVRIFDALNDWRNILTALMAVKTHDGHAEVAMSYTVSPVHDNEHFINFARMVVEHGADSLAIKDMAGLLHPADCFSLVKALREQFGDIEITLHSHCTNGLAVASYIAGMLAGVDNLDTCYGPMAGSTSQPPAELIHYFCQAMDVEHDIDMSLTPKIDKALRKIREELKDVDKSPQHMGNPWPAEPTAEVRKKIDTAVELIASRDRSKIDQAIAIIEDEILVPQGYPEIDREQIKAQIPGGMISNLHNQLKQQNKLDLMPRILEEVPKVRKDTGYVPLVTPTSQIVGTQASFNVMTGESYKMMSNEFRNLIMGKYGKTPGPVNPDVLAKASPDGSAYTERPASYTERINMADFQKEHADVIKTQRDVLLLLLFPGPAKQFLSKRK